MRDSVPDTWTTAAGCTVVIATGGASGAGTDVAIVEKFGVGTMMMALPPMFCEVATARGWAAPPPTAGRGAWGAGLACACGKGDAAGAGEPAGTAFAAGVGVVGALVQAASSATLTTAAIRKRCLGPGDTGKLLLPRDDTDDRANQPAGHDV